MVGAGEDEAKGKVAMQQTTTIQIQIQTGRQYKLKRKITTPFHKGGANWNWLCHAEKVKLRNTIYKDVIAGYTWLGSTRAVSLVVFGSLVEAQDMIGRYKAIEGRRHEYVPEEIR